VRWNLHHRPDGIPEQNPTYALGASFGFAAERLAARETGAGMDTAREYRQRAAVCLRLANESRDAYVREALTELASDLSSMADTAETREVDGRWPSISPRYMNGKSG
jgi:hypothetical protein